MSPPAAPVTSTSNTRPKKPKKPTAKSAKASAKAAAAAVASSSDAENRNEESVDPMPAYSPPAGSVPIDFDADVEFGEFDYDAVKADEGAELWVVRAPSAVKAKNLHGVQVLSSSSSAGRVGDLSRKTTAYDIWSLWPSSSRHSGGGGSSSDSHHPHVGAEELNSLSVLLPSKRKGGKLLLAPKPVTRHLVVAARPPEPTRPGPGDAASDPATFQNPPREAYPDEALTHRFRPYGDPGDPPPPPPEDQMDLDVDDKHAEEGGAKEKEKEKRKKRKGGEAAGSPKKVKKAKTAAS